MIRLFNKVYFFRVPAKSYEYITCFDNKYRPDPSRGIGVNKYTGKVANKYFKLEFIYPPSICSKQVWKF